MKLIFLLLFVLRYPLAQAADSYSITPGSTLHVSEWGLCAEITNNYSTNLLVPTKTLLEWTTFISSSGASKSVARQGCSCKSLLAMGNFTSGNYTLDPDGAGPYAPYTAYCDMVTDGGGWTLAGRSVAGAPNNTSFGFKVSSGSVNDDLTPYSLGALPSDVKFTEVLFGDYTSGKTWGSHVYKNTVPKDFLSTYDNANFGAGLPTPVVGSNAVFYMAYQMGYTYKNYGFHFRDIWEDSTHGLNFDGWWTAYSGDNGGNLLGAQGMIMVR